MVLLDEIKSYSTHRTPKTIHWIALFQPFRYISITDASTKKIISIGAVFIFDIFKWQLLAANPTVREGIPLGIWGGVVAKAPNNVISDGSRVYVENMAADYQQGDSSQ